MRILVILLLVGFCIVSAKYIPQESSDMASVLYRVRRSDSDSNAASEERDDNSSNNNDNNDDNGDNDDNDDDSAQKKEREKQIKLREKEEKEERKRREKLEKERQKEIEERKKQEEKLAKQQRKEQERLEKERRKLQERIEKERRKQEEEQRKVAEKIEKEERKRQEKLKKELENIQKEQEESAEDRYLETEEEDSVEIEDIWKIHVYDKYGINITSTKLERQAALQRYLQEEMGIDANSTKSDRRQAILKLIQTKLQNDTASVDSLRNLMLSHVNAAQIQKMRSKLENDLQELNNKSKVLNNITWPGASVAQQNIEEKRTFLQAIAEFLPSIIPHWFTDSNTTGSSTQTDVSNGNGLNNQWVGTNNVDGRQKVNGPSTNSDVITGPSSPNVVSQIGSEQSIINNYQQPHSASATIPTPRDINTGQNGIIGLPSNVIDSENGVPSIDSVQSSNNPSQVSSSDSLSTISSSVQLPGTSQSNEATKNILPNVNVVVSESETNVPNTVSTSSTSSSVNAASISGSSTRPSGPNDNGSATINSSDNQSNLNVLPKAAADINPELNVASQNIGSLNNDIVSGQSVQNEISANATALSKSGLPTIVSPGSEQSSGGSSQKTSDGIRVPLNYNNVVSGINVDLLPNSAANSGLEQPSTKLSQPNILNDNGSLKSDIAVGQTDQNGLSTDNLATSNSESGVTVASPISGQSPGNLSQTSASSNSDSIIAVLVSESKQTPTDPSQSNSSNQSSSLDKNVVVSIPEITVLPKADIPSVKSDSASQTEQYGESANAVASDNTVSSAAVPSSSGPRLVNTQQTIPISDISALNNRASASSNSDVTATESTSATNLSEANISSQSNLINNIASSPSEATLLPKTASVNSELTGVGQIDQSGATADAGISVPLATTSSISEQPSVNVPQPNGSSDNSAFNSTPSGPSITTTASATMSESTSTNPSQGNASIQSNSVINDTVDGSSQTTLLPKTDATSANSDLASGIQTGQTGALAHAVALDNTVSSATASSDLEQTLPTNNTSNTNVVSDNSAQNNNIAVGESNSNLLPISNSANTGNIGSVINGDVVGMDTKIPTTTVVSSPYAESSSVAAKIESQQSTSNPVQSQIPVDSSSLNSNINLDQTNTIVLPKEVEALPNSNPIEQASNSVSGEPSINLTESNAPGDNGTVKNDIVSSKTGTNVLPDTVIPLTATESLAVTASSIASQSQTSSDISAGQTDSQVLPETTGPSVTAESSTAVVSSNSSPKTTVNNSTLINNIDVGQSNTEVLAQKDSNSDPTKEPSNGGPKQPSNETLNSTPPVGNSPVKNDIAADQSTTEAKVSVSPSSDLSSASKVEPEQPSVAPSQPSTRGDNGLLENNTSKNNKAVPEPVTVTSGTIPETTSETSQSDVIVVPVDAAILPSSEPQNDTAVNISDQLLTNSPLSSTSENSSLSSDLVGTTNSSTIIKEVSLPTQTVNLTSNSESIQVSTDSILNNNLNGSSSSGPADSSTVASQINTVAGNDSSNLVTDAIVAVSTGSESFTSSPDVTDITSTNTKSINENMVTGNTISQISTVNDADTTSPAVENVKAGDLPTVSVNSPLITIPQPVIPVKVQVEPGTVVVQENVNTPTNSAQVSTEVSPTSAGPVIPDGVTVPDEPGASIVGIKTQ